MRKFLVAFFVFVGLLVSIPNALAYESENPITATTMFGRWQDRDGHVIDIYYNKYGAAFSYVSDIIRRDDNITIIVLAINGGRDIKELYFYNNNPDYFMVKPYTSRRNGEVTLYNDYSRVPYNTPLTDSLWAN